MNTAALDIERIVREVLRRVAELSPADTNGSGGKHSTLVLDDKVVTLATLERRLGGIRTVVVAERAVVTPAVRDELRQRNIELRNTEKNGTETAARLVVYNESSRDVSGVLRGAAVCEQIVADDLSAAVATICQRTGDSHELGLILTSTPAAAACQANRDPSIRAAVAVNGEMVRDAVRSIDANVLVAPATLSVHALRNLVSEYVGR